ncbi:hypothetical protein [Sulfurovum sp.]|uniref:hypothetical protein n=1 Tax=Sulfurovum sp. TaxID=1969726 RepID=UPI003569345D
MKLFLLLLLTFTTLFATAQLEHVTIKNQDFSIVTETYDIYDSKGEVMKLYKEERSNDLDFVLSLILKDRTGTCSDQSMQDGSYEINDTEITLYSFWDRKGKSYDSPYGARIQRYEMLPNHTVVLKSSKVYIETARINYDKESGMKYLFTPPKNNTETETLQMYVRSVEREYKGDFVYDDDAKKLIDDVQEALRRRMKAKWQR